MILTRIAGPVEAHPLVRDLDSYRVAHRLGVAKERARGMDVEVHEVTEPVVARINWGRWIVDCVSGSRGENGELVTRCNNGPACHPDMPVALCFECGAIYENVRFPDPVERAEIERKLMARRAPQARNWSVDRGIEP